jgi:hypothetical protein
MELGWPLPRRLELLRRLVKSVSSETEQVKFQGALQHFPIYKVPLALPKYRLANGRTQAAQEEFLAVHADEYPIDFFTRDDEAETAQAIQHEILEGMVDEEGLLTYFRTEHQEYPLILTHDGFVLNGNRRLCAYRRLYAEDPKLYRHFDDVQVVILPDCDDRALDSLEAHLQVTKDIRADYSWVSMAVMYRKRMKPIGEFTTTEIELAQNLKEGEVTKAIDMLSYAEAYLSFRGTPKQYKFLTRSRGGGDSKYAFEELVKARKKIKRSPQRRAVLEKVSYTLMEDPKGRLYRSIPGAAEYLSPIIDALLEELKPPKGSAAPGGSVESYFGAGDERVDGLVAALSDYKNADIVREVATEVIQTQEDLDRERKSKNFVFNQIKKANTYLSAAKNAIGERTPRDGIVAQLATAGQTVDELAKWANQ